MPLVKAEIELPFSHPDWATGQSWEGLLGCCLLIVTFIPYPKASHWSYLANSVKILHEFGDEQNNFVWCLKFLIIVSPLHCLRRIIRIPPVACQQDPSSGLGVLFPILCQRDGSLTDHQETHLALNGLSADDITHPYISAHHLVSPHSIIYLFIHLIGPLYQL